MTTTELLERFQVEAVSEIDPIPDGYELIDGELREMPNVGAQSSWMVGRIFRHLDDWCAHTGGGLAITGEAGYRCFGRAAKVRKPDVSVIVCDPRTFVIPREDFRVVPNLVVEVVSPNETVEGLNGKVVDFRRAGTALIWVIDPSTRSATITRGDGTMAQLFEPAELSGEDVLPGFTLPLAAILPRPIPGAEEQA